MIGQTEYAPVEDPLRWRQLIGVVRLHKWSILVLALCGLLGAALFTQQQARMFTSNITVIATDPLARVGDRTFVTQPDMNAEQSLVNSLPVAQCAQQILSNPELNNINADVGEICAADQLAKARVGPELKQNLHVEAAPDSVVLRIRDSETNPERAQGVAQAFGIAYRHYKTTQATQTLSQLRAGPQAQLTKVNNQIADLDTLIAEDITAVATSALNAHLQQRTVLVQQQTALITQLSALSPDRIDPPKLLAPASQGVLTSPNRNLNLAAGLFLGILMGFGIALLRDRMSDSLRGRGDLESAAGAPVLAVIPRVPRWKRRSETKLVVLQAPKSAPAEAYRNLRTSLMFAAAQRGVKTIMVTSPVAGEGKTTTAANLAVALASANKRVILVSADLRKPRIHHFFGMPNDRGLSNVLRGEVQPWEVLGNPDIENLRIMAGGPIPDRPGELLQSEQMKELVSSLREIADFVVLDTPPVLLVADSSAMAPLSDGVLLVADAQETTKSSIRHARDTLEQVDAPIMGAVLNNFDPSKVNYYGYGTYYGYGRYRYTDYRSPEAYGMEGRDGGDRSSERALISRFRKSGSESR